MDPEAALELKKRSSLLREHGIGKSLHVIWRPSSLMYVTILKFINIVCNSFYIILNQSWFLTTVLSNYDINKNCYNCSLSIKTVVEDTISKAKINLSEVADTLKGDWVILATQLDISGDEIHKINGDYRTVNDQALAMLSLWKEKKGDQATGQWVERSRALFTKVIVSKKMQDNVHRF